MRTRIDLPVEEVAARYKIGESTYGLGAAYGVDPETIRCRLREAGVELRGRGVPGNKNGRHRPGGPLHTDADGYSLTRNREGKQCFVHRGCWGAYRGPIPAGHVIHHVDEDRQHNAIENLECMPLGKHIRLHAAMQRGRKR